MFFGLHRRHTRTNAPKTSRLRVGYSDQLSYGILQLHELEPRVLMAATQLSFFVQPSQMAAGSPSQFSQLGSIEVAVLDQNGNIVTTDNSKVTLAIPIGLNTAPLNASIGGTISVNAIGGIATFPNVTFNVSGNYSIEASDGTLVPVASNTFTVTTPATKLGFIAQPIDIPAGGQESLTVAIEDASGNVVTTDRSTVTLSVASGPSGVSLFGSNNGTVTGVAVNGIVTFTGTIPTAGTYRLLAHDGTLTNATSSAFAVSAGTAAKLGFVQQPTSTASGQNITPSVTVDVLDSFGNIITTDNSAVTLTVAGNPIATVNAVNGVATFDSLSFIQPGNFTLVASDGSLTSVNSNQFAVTGPPSQLLFQRGPAQATVGTVLQPIIVDVADAGGNTVVNDNSMVTISVASGPGVIGGTTTVTAVNGVATFNTITLSQAGIYTLTVTDGVLTPATSGNVLINGLASKLAFLVQPSDGAANAAIAPAVKVLVEDSNGNIVIDNTSNVTISVNSGPGAINGITIVAAVNGVATFADLVPTLAGTYTLLASDGALTTAISNSFTVSPSASQLAFVQGPSDVGANSVMAPIVVDILNDFGMLVTTNTTQVTLAIISGPQNATIGGTTTVSAVGGVATFNDISFGVRGTYTLIAFDGILATATSDAFGVNAPPAKLKIGSPPTSTVIAGNFMQGFTITVVDALNHIVTTDNSTLTLAIAKGPTGGAIVSGATASAVDGVAHFTDVKFNIAGKYTLTATDGTLTSVSTNAFTVTPQISTAHVLIAATPTSSTLVGKSLISAVKVDIADQFGNIITNSNAQVKVSKLGGNGTLSGSTTVNAVNGVATFSNLSFNLAGTESLMVQSLSLANPATTSFNITVSQVVSTLSKPSTSNPYSSGGTITLTGQLAGLVGSSVSWGGTVTAVDGNNAPLPAVITGTVSSSGVVKVNIVGLAPAVYNVKLRYNGDANHIGATSAAVKVQVNDHGATATTTAITDASTGSTITLTTTINTNAGPNRTGNVTFLEGSTVLGIVPLSANQASFTINNASIGGHTYTVQYTGDPTFKPSSANINESVLANVDTTTTLTTNFPTGTTNIATGSTLTVAATIVSNHGNVAPPSGSVELFDGATLLQTIPLTVNSANSTGVFTSFVPIAGVHHYSLKYLGDTHSYLPSTSGTLTLTVA